MTGSADSAAELTHYLELCEFPPPRTRVNCAVSGGADSLCLLVLAVKHGLEVTAIHVDHGIRQGSDQEADLVAAAAQGLGAEFLSRSVEVSPGPDLEQRARIARRRVLPPGTLTGHTADDQAETVLINLIRGTGLNGLAGMTPGGIHPILRLRRRDTEAVCSLAHLEPFHDPSNSDPRFIRNRIRHEVLPLLDDVAQRDVVPLLNRTATHAREEVELERWAISDIDPTEVKTLRNLPGPVARACLRTWLIGDEGHPPSSASIERVMAVVRGEAVACEIEGGRRVGRSGGRLRVD